jgi:hypothetical protein
MWMRRDRMWDILDYIDLTILYFWDMLCGDRVQVLGNDFPKPDPEKL